MLQRSLLTLSLIFFLFALPLSAPLIAATATSDPTKMHHFSSQFPSPPAAPPASSGPTSSEPATDSSRSSVSITSTERRNAIGLGLGETYLQGNLRNFGADRVSVDFFYSYFASYSFDFIANAHYSKHQHQEEQVKLKGFDFGIKGKIYQQDVFSPFVVGGLGLYRPTTKRKIATATTSTTGSGDQQLLESQAATVLGIHLGLGADLKLNEFLAIGLLTQYHDPFDVKQTAGPKVEGAYLKLMMTCMYYFNLWP